METILIVDDEKVIREGCRRALSSEGFRVLMAANGQEALDIISKEKIEVVLCDLKMPVMGALEVMKEVCKRFPGIPMIIITGQGTINNAVECMKAGAYDFITKPFRIEDIVELVKRAKDRIPPPSRLPHINLL